MEWQKDNTGRDIPTICCLSAPSPSSPLILDTDENNVADDRKIHIGVKLRRNKKLKLYFIEANDMSFKHY